MPDCPACGLPLLRTPRGWFTRLFYRERLQCRACATAFGIRRIAIDLPSWFIWSRYTRCVRCGTDHVHRAGRLDHVDSISGHLLSQLLRLTGAPVTRCVSCRLQYFDWRQPRPR